MAEGNYYLKPRHVSDRMGVAVKTLANWRVLGKGPPHVKMFGGVRYPSDGFERWLRSWDGTPRRK